MTPYLKSVLRALLAQIGKVPPPEPVTDFRELDVVRARYEQKSRVAKLARAAQEMDLDT